MIRDYEEVHNLASDNNNYIRLHRINYNGKRLYIRKDPFQFYSGLTGALEASGFKGDPESKVLSGWRDRMIEQYGKQEMTNYVKATADFGTLLHEALVRIKDNGKIVWHEEQELAEQYFHNSLTQKGIFDIGTVRRAVYEYQKHVSALMQFIYDRVEQIDAVRPAIYAIETPAISEPLRIATPIDLACSCRQTPKGEFMKTTINIKTSKQISKHQLEQAAFENLMWNDTYEKFPCTHTGILRTKDWIEGKTPTYEYKYLKPDEIAAIVTPGIARLSLCLQSSASYLPRNAVSKRFQGETKLGEVPDISIVKLEEEWSQFYNDRQLEEIQKRMDWLANRIQEPELTDSQEDLQAMELEMGDLVSKMEGLQSQPEPQTEEDGQTGG